MKNYAIVADKQWQDLSNVVSAMAADAIKVQERLDASHAESLARFVKTVAGVPPEVGVLLGPLAPKQLEVMQHRVSCSLRVSSSRSIGYSLMVQGINLGSGTLYGSSTTEESSLCVEVTRMPIHKPPAC